MDTTRAEVLWKVLMSFVIVTLLMFAMLGLMLKLEIDRQVIQGNNQQNAADSRSLENQADVLKNQEEILKILRRLDKVEDEVKTIKKDQWE